MKALLPETEVSAKGKRRQYSAEEKRRVLAEAEACTKPGELGALLRREGLYSSHLVTWRRQRENGEIAGLTPKKRGRKPAVVDARDREIAELKQEKARLEARLEKAETIIEVQKKVSLLLGVELPQDPGSMRKK